jgi:hypothetical protein
MSGRHEDMARLVWDAAYPHIPWNSRHRGWTMADVHSAAATVLHILDRGDGKIDRLELILQDVLYRAGVNNPLSGAARLVDGPLRDRVA